MSARAPLPLFESPDDARSYLFSVRAVVGGMMLLVLAALLSFPLDVGLITFAVGIGGLVLIVLGQALYLLLNARIWARHYPHEEWDWRTARGFYEGTFRGTVARARALARH